MNKANYADDDGLVGAWTFDEVRVERVEVKMVRGETFVPTEKLAYVKESVSGDEHKLYGKYYEAVDGVKGNAVLLDGYTAYVEVPRSRRYRVSGDFSLEAWIATGAYPKHWCPIVDHQRDVAEGYFNGYFFGIDAKGRLMLRIAANGRNIELLSNERIELNKWTYVAGVYSTNDGLKIYINGELVGKKKVKDEFSPLQEERMVPLMIGKSRTKHRPYGTIRPEGTMEVNTHFDGMIDNVFFLCVHIFCTKLSGLLRVRLDVPTAGTGCPLVWSGIPRGAALDRWGGQVYADDAGLGTRISPSRSLLSSAARFFVDVPTAGTGCPLVWSGILRGFALDRGRGKWYNAD